MAMHVTVANLAMQEVQRVQAEVFQGVSRCQEPQAAAGFEPGSSLQGIEVEFTIPATQNTLLAMPTLSTAGVLQTVQQSHKSCVQDSQHCTSALRTRPMPAEQAPGLGHGPSYNQLCCFLPLLPPSNHQGVAHNNRLHAASPAPPAQQAAAHSRCTEDMSTEWQAIATKLSGMQLPPASA